MGRRGRCARQCRGARRGQLLAVSSSQTPLWREYQASEQKKKNEDAKAARAAVSEAKQAEEELAEAANRHRYLSSGLRTERSNKERGHGRRVGCMGRGGSSVAETGGPCGQGFSLAGVVAAPRAEERGSWPESRSVLARSYCVKNHVRKGHLVPPYVLYSHCKHQTLQKRQLRIPWTPTL